jgi:H+-translocating NAD(P) transhydrogenase subunit alpha
MDDLNSRTTIGVVAESGTDERRVALVPKAVASLTGSGLAVVDESGAGEGALLPDALYTEAGASIGDAWAADVVVKVAPPTADEVGKLRSGQTLIGFLAPRNADNSIGALRAAGVQAFALDVRRESAARRLMFAGITVPVPESQVGRARLLRAFLAGKRRGSAS